MDLEVHMREGPLRGHLSSMMTSEALCRLTKANLAAMAMELEMGWLSLLRSERGILIAMRIPPEMT